MVPFPQSFQPSLGAGMAVEECLRRRKGDAVSEPLRRLESFRGLATSVLDAIPQKTQPVECRARPRGSEGASPHPVAN